MHGFVRDQLVPLLLYAAGRGMNPRALANSTWGLAKLGFIPERQQLVHVSTRGGQGRAACWVC